MVPARPPLVLNSLPKAGTHLLLRVFKGLPAYKPAGVEISRKIVQDREDPVVLFPRVSPSPRLRVSASPRLRVPEITR
jgi:hypothetical protein